MAKKPAVKEIISLTIEKCVNDELAVPLDQVVDVAKDSTGNCKLAIITPQKWGKKEEERLPHTTCWAKTKSIRKGDN